MTSLREVTPRHHHYATFYQLESPPTPAARPRVAVIGNCQAESLRILLDSTGAISSFRIPPIHEWETDDLPFVRAALTQTDVLVMQQVRADYRGLPIGTAQLARLLPAHARILRFPVLRFDALHPYLAIIRPPSDPGLNPPIVPYHDLRILARAAGLSQPRAVPAEAYGDCARVNVAELARREARDGIVVMSDYLETNPVWHTLNHPDNATLAELARRVLRALAVDGEVSPPADREMLGRLQAPILPAAAAALGVSARRPEWLQDGKPIPQADINAAHLAFYAAHPEAVAAGLQRHSTRLNTLGFSQ
ncbi:WcbI family polysaccharide biosynthesis putative acetyltransferase [Staphylococcus chromogenes]|nr:WcbI family polysaccharide biosynthesis putative acetyltransferase [Staphylococcus chromogenes]